MVIRLRIARSIIGGLHCRHVDGKNKRKFAHTVRMTKIIVNSIRIKIRPKS